MDTNVNQKVSCIVKQAYEARNPDELTLRVGDVVRDAERLPQGWWRGDLRGRRGMFSDNYVSVIDQPSARSGGVQGRCRAVFSYQPANPDELTLCVGDVLDVLGEVEEGWWQGRRQGREGVFPSNFVVMLDPPAGAPASEPAPKLPPKPVKELCRVLFPYSAVNEDELTLNEGDVVTIISKDAPDRGWWYGELRGKQGLFPDNFVQLIHDVAQDAEEKKPDRPPQKSTSPLYPILNKYSEKIISVKELTTSKVSLHKENTASKESSTHSTVTHTNKNDTEKIINNETVTDGDSQVKKPPVPSKKSPTPIGGVGGLFSGLKSKMLSSSDKDREKEASLSPQPPLNSSSESDRLDGAGGSRPQPDTFDRITRNSILNDPRAQRVKAPRRRPPSQALKDDTPIQLGLSNGHEATERPLQPAEKTDETKAKAEEIKPKTRDWGKQKAPWMEELKLNQAKKTSFSSDAKSRSQSSSSESGITKATSGSTDRLLEVGLEEKRSSHSMEMSKSTSSISNRISVLESFEETKVRHSLDSKKESNSSHPKETEISTTRPAAIHSPTAAGRTLTTMLEDIRKPSLTDAHNDKLNNHTSKQEKVTTAKYIEYATGEKTQERTHSATSEKTHMGNVTERTNVSSMEKSHFGSEKLHTSEKSHGYGASEKLHSMENNGLEEEKPVDKPVGSCGTGGTGERRRPAAMGDADALIAQLNSRITNLEKLLEVQNAKFNAAIEELNTKLLLESEKRQALQNEVEKLAHCVTQV